MYDYKPSERPKYIESFFANVELEGCGVTPRHTRAVVHCVEECRFDDRAITSQRHIFDT
ncbi:MAG: hypothetical protein ABI231_07450 [Candidatus Tumulicola sp.]